MKPIIIGVKNGKIELTLEEFRRFMNDAYDQGYRDNLSITYNTTTDKWWNSPYCNTAITGTASTATTSINTAIKVE